MEWAQDKACSVSCGLQEKESQGLGQAFSNSGKDERGWDQEAWGETEQLCRALGNTTQNKTLGKSLNISSSVTYEHYANLEVSLS